MPSEVKRERVPGSVPVYKNVAAKAAPTRIPRVAYAGIVKRHELTLSPSTA